MAGAAERASGWLERRRERKRLERERTGDSPELRVEHHRPPGDAIDVMLASGGVARKSRFKPDGRQRP
jgi:hypothetical protein